MRQSTLHRMQDACAAVSRGDSPFSTFIEACADAADDLADETSHLGSLGLFSLAKRMRTNSERWFPSLHDGHLDLRVFYTLGLAGEVGEVANLVKKMVRGVYEKPPEVDIGAELADIFTYLLLLADELDVDLLIEYENKATYNERRWGK